MKKYLLISILTLTALSCNNSNQQRDEIPDLSTRITELEKENKSLKDSISNYERDFLRSQIIVGIPEAEVIKAGKKNKIYFLFNTFGKKLPPYEIFRVENEKEFKIGVGDSTQFTYDFIPKSSTDTDLDLIVKIPMGKDTFSIPAGMRLRAED